MTWVEDNQAEVAFPATLDTHYGHRVACPQNEPCIVGICSLIVPTLVLEIYW